MAARARMFALMLSLFSVSIAQILAPFGADLGSLPYRLLGTWRMVGSTRGSPHNTGVVELNNENTYGSLHTVINPVRVNLRVHEANNVDYQAWNAGVQYFWHSLLGTPTRAREFTTVVFPGYGVIDRRAKQLVVVNKHTSIENAFKTIRPNGMTKASFLDMMKRFDSLNRDYYGYYYGGRVSTCDFVLRLDISVDELPPSSARRMLTKATGRLESRNCSARMALTMDDMSRSTFTGPVRRFGITVTLLYAVQLAAVGLQLLYGWRKQNTRAVSLSGVAMLFLLTAFYTVAHSIFADVVWDTKASFIAAAVFTAFCSTAYALWFLLILTERRKSILHALAEGVVQFVAAVFIFVSLFFALRLLPGLVALFAFGMYSFFVPQIVSSKNSKESATALHPAFIVTTAIINAYIPMHFWLTSSAFLGTSSNPLLAMLLSAFIVAQAGLLLVQFKGTEEHPTGGYAAIVSPAA